MVETFLVVAGLCLGSFVNALVWRLRKQSRAKKKTDDYSIVHGRSMCSQCQHPLAPSDLVPVLSWLWLRGKCRYCRKPIPDTPLPELLMLMLLLVSYYAWPSTLAALTSPLGVALFATWALVLTCFVALALYDARWFLLPDRVVLPLTILSLVFTILCIVSSGDWRVGAWALAAAATMSGLFYAIELVSKGRWIGHGDVKLAVSLGLLVGGPVKALLVVFVASLLGTLYLGLGLVLGTLKRSKKPLLQTMLPFGPFLIAATFVVFFWGEQLIGWYLTLFL